MELASILRPLVFALTILLAWVGVKPFANLADPSLLGTTEEGNPLNQVAYLAVATLLFATAAYVDRRVFSVFKWPLLILSLGWIGCSVVFSDDPSLAGRRFLFAALVVAMAGVVLILPRNLREFADILSGIALLIIFVCFAGVAIAPGVSVHQASDVADALAGDWRGLFAHKNIAAPMMVVFVFLGLYVAEVRSRVVGWLIIVGAVLFLIFTHGKTASMLLPFVLVLSWLILRLKSTTARNVVLLGGLLIFNLATLGSAYSESIRNVAGLVLPDVTYTGRTEIWRFAIDHVRQRPLTGYGLGTFWGSSKVLNGAETQADDGPNLVAHAHNGFLNLALEAGLPALFFAALSVLLTPLFNLKKIMSDDPDRPLTLFFVRLWLFGVYMSCFESVLFNRADPVWFCMLIAMFGLRLMTRCRFAPSTRLLLQRR